MVIVGGGITGLAAALIASKSGAKVTVLEASDEPGGLLKTFEIGQNRLEHFYHHFFNHDAELHWLISHLGLEEKVIYKNTRMGVFREGKIFDFTTPRDLLSYTPMNWLDKLRFVISSWYLGNWAKWQKNEHISAYRWLARWSGKSTFEALWKPLLDVKFGSLAHSVPLAWMIGRLRQRFHSRRAGQEQLGYMHGSLQVLLDALIGRLKDSGVNLIVNAKVDQVTVSNNCLLNVIANESFIDGDKFLFTIPGNYVGDMLRPTHSSLSHRLNEVKYFNAVCVILELNKALTDKYWLNIADPGYAFGGVIEQTNFVDPIQYNGSHIVYLSRYFSDEEAVILFLLILAGVIFIIFFGSMLAPAIAAVIVAFILQGLVTKLNRLGIPEIVSIIGVFFVFLGLLIGVLFGLLPLIWTQVTGLAGEAPRIFREMQSYLEVLPEQYPTLISMEGINTIYNQVTTEAGRMTQWLVSFSLESIPDLVALLIYMVLLPILVFFFLKDRRVLLGAIARMLPSQRMPLVAQSKRH